MSTRLNLSLIGDVRWLFVSLCLPMEQDGLLRWCGFPAQASRSGISSSAPFLVCSILAMPDRAYVLVFSLSVSCCSFLNFGLVLL